ncbi:hypothetical protein GAG94_03650 [Lysinibacillus sphaericus]|nr:hypothetical protein GAG94_03650 [Lysinibacillus sphaericus]
MLENTYVNAQTGEVLDMDMVAKLIDSAMLKVKPELWYEWNFEKNNEIGLDVCNVTKGSTKKAHWICHKCDSEFYSRIDSRSKINGSNCPYCSGQKVNESNSLSSKRVDLLKLWNFDKNKYISPHDVTPYSDKRVWWVCEKGHEWKNHVREITSGKRCSICANKKVNKGNCLWTTNPEIASLLLNPDDGYKVTHGSKVKLDWKCICGNIIKNKDVISVKTKTLCCEICSDNITLPEKIMSIILNQLGVSYINNRTTKWSGTKKYDFIINYEDKNIIIETHGGQHYGNWFRGKKNELENDKFKRELALSNGIDIYIELDCSNSTISYIKNSIYESEMKNIFDLNLIDWTNIALLSLESKMLKACKLYSYKKYSQLELASILDICESTLRRYLTRGHEAGLCSYTPNSGENKELATKHFTIEVVQLSLDGNLIAKHNSIASAGISLNKTSLSSISYVCKGKAKTAYGYRWVYLEDYEKQFGKLGK